MATFTTTKTIGKSGATYSTPALWESDGDVDLTAAQQWSAGTFVGTFTQAETLTWTGGTGKFLDSDGSTYISFAITTGNTATLVTITGSTSGAHCVGSSNTFTGCIWEGQCINAADEYTAAGNVLTVAGATTSSTCYKFLTTGTGASFRDNVNVRTNALRYNASNGFGIRSTGTYTATIVVTDSYFSISNIQVKAGAANHSWAIAGATGGVTPGNISRADFCIFEGPATGSAYVAVVCPGGAASVFTNCLFMCTTTTANSFHCVNVRSTTAAFYACSFGFTASNGSPVVHPGSGETVTLESCWLGTGTTTIALPTSQQTYTTCASDSNTTIPSGVTGNLTATSQITTPTGASYDYREASGAALQSAGTLDLTYNSFDISGFARPGSSAPDIGCWQLASGTKCPWPFFNMMAA